MAHSKTVDCRGFACPRPVLSTREALAEPGVEYVVTIVDNPAARENVARFARNAGWEVEVRDENGIYYLTLVKPAGQAPPQPGRETTEPQRSAPEGQRPVYLVGSNILGQGSQDLGQVLMKSAFVSLAAMETLPDTVCFLNSGVYLCIKGSPVLEELNALAEKGATILVCGTCLEYYGVKDKLVVGRLTNMLEIQESLAKGNPSVTLG